MINCCDEISDPTPIHIASRIAQDHDPIEAGSFVESDRIEKSWADEKLVIRSLFHSDRIVSGIGPWWCKPWYWPGGWFNKKIPSYQHRKSDCGEKTILWPSYFHNRISYTGKTSLYWIRAQVLLENTHFNIWCRVCKTTVAHQLLAMLFT